MVKVHKAVLLGNISTGLAQVYALRFKYMNVTGKPMKVRMQFIDSKGVVLKEDNLTFAENSRKVAYAEYNDGYVYQCRLL